MAESVQTVVAYESWRKGYMPPSEHILIDQLSYRGARVVMSSDFGDVAWWLVVRGEKLYGRKLLAVRAAIEAALDAMAEEKQIIPESTDQN